MNEWEWQLLEDKPLIDHLTIISGRGEIEIKLGDRIRLRPNARGDVMDLALAGKVALVEAMATTS